MYKKTVATSDIKFLPIYLATTKNVGNTNCSYKTCIYIVQTKNGFKTWNVCFLCNQCSYKL